MNCNEVRSVLQDYVTRELAPERRAGVDEHVVGCAECQRELALLTALVSSLDSQPVVEPEADFTARVIRRLPGHRRAPMSPWWSLAAVPALGAAAWLLRGPLLRGAAGVADRLGLRVLPAPGGASIGYAQFAWSAAVAVVFAVAVLATGVYLGWRIVRER